MGSDLAINYDIFSSTRYDISLLGCSWNTEICSEPSPYLLFPFHVDRLRSSAQRLGWTSAIATMNSDNIDNTVRRACDQAVASYDNKEDTLPGLRLRIILSKMGDVSAQAFPAQAIRTDSMIIASTLDPSVPSFSPPATINVVQLFLDTQHTPINLFTKNKTTHRTHYDDARTRVGLSPTERNRDVILFNETEEILETSIRNLAVWREGGWVTSPETSGCLPGTMRRWLLEHGRVREGTVPKSDLRPGEWLLLSNGVEGCTLGRLV